MGHVFVVHGNLLKIAADAVLIPCDASADVNEHWGRFALQPGEARKVQRELHGGRVSEVRSGSGQRYRYVDTGSTPAGARARWLADGVVAGLTAIGSDLEGVTPAHERLRPLVAMPVFGVGDGGFDHIRGAALQAVLARARRATDTAEFDVVIVCFNRSDFAAMQLQRKPSHWTLSAVVRRHASSLAAAIGAKRVVLFLGAGVSMSAGLGNFEYLVSNLEQLDSKPHTQRRSRSLPKRVEELKDERGVATLNRQVARLVRRNRYSVVHGLLASMRCREAITTNFDQLYEKACERPFLGSQVEVLPWQRTSTSRPWLLKAHGDPQRGGSLILDAASFRAFERERAPVAGVVRAMFALSREVVFVGYSLRDPNIAKLIAEARAFHASYGVKHARLGTVIDIESAEIDLDANPARLGIRLGPHENVVTAAHRLEMLLDYVSWRATRAEASWLLDERYASLLTSPDEQRSASKLASAEVPTTGNWPQVRDQLEAFGRRRS
jgi:hypothetical protein